MNKRFGLGALLVLILSIGVMYGYLKTELEFRSFFFGRPREVVSALLKVRRGSTLLEAESLLSDHKLASPGWQLLEVSHYSGGAALYTRLNGASLYFPADMGVGTYELHIRVWAYDQGTNRVALDIDGRNIELSWDGISPARPVTLIAKTTLRSLQKGFVLRTEHVSQPYVVIDGVDLFGPGDQSAKFSLSRAAMYSLSIGSVAVLFVSGLTWGSFLLNKINLSIESSAALLVLSVALGLGFLGTMVTILGTIGLFKPLVVWLTLVSGMVLGLRQGLTTLRSMSTAIWRLSLPHKLVTVCVGLILIAGAIPSFAPAAGVDTHIYHLATPKWLINEGAFTYHPYQIVWGYPHLVPNLYALTQGIYNEPFFRPAQLTHSMLGALWILSVYAIGRHMYGRGAGTGAALLCLGIEGVIVQMGLALVDFGFSLFACTSILALLMALGGRPNEYNRSLILSAVLSGYAAVCKVNGPTMAVAIAITVAAVEISRRNLRGAIKGFALVGAISLVVAMPMYIKNIILYYNPLYPFFGFLPNRDLSPEFLSRWISTNTWDKFVLGLRPEVKVGWPYFWVIKKFVDPLSPGPAVVCAPLIVALNWSSSKKHWPLLLLITLLAVLWFFISPLTRFAWPWLAVLYVFACSPISLRAFSTNRGIISILLILCTLPILTGEMMRSIGAVNNIRGLESDSAFRARKVSEDAGKVFVPPFEGVDELNKLYRLSPSRERVLIDTNLVAYADFPTVPAPYYLMIMPIEKRNWALIGPGPICLNLSAKTVPDQDLIRELRERLNIRHILVKKGMPTPPQSAGGRYNDSKTGELLAFEDDRFDIFISRWVAQGIVTRHETKDSVRYTFKD